jgi:hypothetical protein
MKCVRKKGKTRVMDFLVRLFVDGLHVGGIIHKWENVPKVGVDG